MKVLRSTNAHLVRSEPIFLILTGTLAENICLTVRSILQTASIEDIWRGQVGKHAGQIYDTFVSERLFARRITRTYD